MKKKFLIIAVCLFMTVTSVFAKGFTNLPSSGKELVLMQGGKVIWHAANWSLEIDSVKYTDMRFFQNGGDDYFKIYTFTGTPVGPGKDDKSSTTSWSTISIIDCENLTWMFR